MPGLPGEGPLDITTTLSALAPTEDDHPNKRAQSLKQLVTTAVERELATPAAEGGNSRQQQAAVDASLRELESLSQRISAAWTQSVTAVEAIRDQRRDL